MHESAIVYDTLNCVNDLAVGYTDEQDGEHYRLKKRNDAALFGYTVGPHSWKQFLHLPVLRLWSAQRSTEGLQIHAEDRQTPKLAFLGVRSCELHAIAIQDRIFLHTQQRDPTYQARREHLCIIAINCGQASGTCFCASMQTGPQVTADFDLALTEILDEMRHFFLVEIGTALRNFCAVPSRVPGAEETSRAEHIVAQAAAQVGRTMETTDIKDLLYRNVDHPRWENVTTRCLSCGNCTMVCPTCFCTTVEDTADLTGERAERWRRWDSCFTVDFSHLVGGSVGTSSKFRYRQWMTHKLASWIDQLGTLGCVGCRRCITWCPVGIDIPAEVRAIRENPDLPITQRGEP